MGLMQLSKRYGADRLEAAHLRARLGTRQQRRGDREPQCAAKPPSRPAAGRRILATAPEHPWVSAWWPDAHVLGYEHGFVNMAADIARAVSRRRPVVPLPDFADAYETQRVLEAALVSASERCAIRMSEVR